MNAYIVRRLWQMLPTILGVVVLVFVLVMIAIVAGLDFGFGKVMFKIFA